MGLASAAVADGDDVLAALDVFAAGQFHDQGLVHRGDRREVKGVQALDCRESGGADPPLHHALVAVDEFQFGEAQQILRVVHILGGALGGHLHPVACPRVQQRRVQVWEHRWSSPRE